MAMGNCKPNLCSMVYRPEIIKKATFLVIFYDFFDFLKILHDFATMVRDYGPKIIPDLGKPGLGFFIISCTEIVNLEEFRVFRWCGCRA